jgi:hypothetical protein
MNFEELEREYADLHDKYTKLLSDYSENTIIQSMNDMKAKYDEMLLSTIPVFKYNQIMEKCKKYEKERQASIVLLEHISKGLFQCENARLLNSYRVNQLKKAQTGLLLLKEILESESKN